MALAERALEHFVNKTTDQAETTMEIPLGAYKDEERYAREIERVFKHLPLALALSLELSEAGSYKAMTVMGVPLLIVRGEDLKVINVHYEQPQRLVHFIAPFTLLDHSPHLCVRLKLLEPVLLVVC